MSASVGLSGAFADAAILLVLVAVLASRAMTQLARLLTATFAFLCAWLLTAVFGALRAPGWTMFVGSAVMVVSIAVMIGAVHVWAQAREGGEGEGEHRGEDGEGGPRRRRPDAPEPGGGSTDLSWWPEFERQLAFYIAERDGRTQPAPMFERTVRR